MNDIGENILAGMDYITDNIVKIIVISAICSKVGGGTCGFLITMGFGLKILTFNTKKAKENTSFKPVQIGKIFPEESTAKTTDTFSEHFREENTFLLRSCRRPPI